MDKILVLDFGGQYNQLIARRVRALHVYAEIRTYDGISIEEIKDTGYKGIIFTGGPNSVYDDKSPHFDPAIVDMEIPILGICYGHQLLAYMTGGSVGSAVSSGEYGRTEVEMMHNRLFDKIPARSIFWMSHNDYVDRTPVGFEIIARTEKCPCAGMCDEERKLYGVQFHPEVTHSEYGQQVLSNFVLGICDCNQDWNMDDFIEKTVCELRQRLQGRKVLLGLSGGVDSSVAAVLLHKSIGDNLICVLVDHGLLRENEAEYVVDTFKGKYGLNLIKVDVSKVFLKKLKGVTDPETKRKIIGREFVEAFQQEAKIHGRIDALAQGTIYPDVVESGNGKSAVIKSHHNVGGLPEHMHFDMIVEPLRMLFKDEVREVGEKLGLPKQLVWRQPFPGPGLAVRIIGEVTEEKLSLLKKADSIFRYELELCQDKNLPAQYFAVLLDSKSVGVMGDARTYGYTLALRAVDTDDFMTASCSRLPYEVLERISSRITNEIKGITRVVYDITSKPPATVEWE